MKSERNINYFSKRCLIFVITFLFIFSACDKSILDEKPLDFLTPSNAFTTVDGIEQGSNALYDAMRIWFMQTSTHTLALFAIGTDISFDGESPGGQRFLTDYSQTLHSEDIEVSRVWQANYTNIQRCNVLINSIEAADPIIWQSDAEKNIYLAEAMLFRAFSYRVLVTFWGDVPLIIDVINTPVTDLTRTPKAEVYQQIESDLIFAAQNLPERGQAAPGKLTKGVAWHYLSEIYLAQGKFQLAVDAASEVIDNLGYALMTERFGTNLDNDVFGTGDPFYDLFTPNNQNLPENTEGIWIIQFDPFITGGGLPGYATERSYGPRYFSFGNTPDGFRAFRGEFVNGVYTGFSDTLGRGVSRCRLTNYVAYDIWKGNWDNDIRNAEHNIKRNYYFDNPASIYHHQKVDLSLYPPGSRDLFKDTINYLYPYHLKFSDVARRTVNLPQSGGGWNFKDVYAIRLPETLLLRAEAYLGLNNLEAAAADINTIRNRANAIPIQAGDVSIDLILDERARELFGEEQRTLTLLRLGKLVERVRLYHSNPLRMGAGILDHHNLWPIPQADIDLNIGAEMVQNPGYN